MDKQILDNIKKVLQSHLPERAGSQDIFNEEYLEELYTKGNSSNKKIPLSAADRPQLSESSEVSIINKETGYGYEP